LSLCCVECDVKEAVALYNFRARTKRELSFNKGDVLMLYERVSADWWEGMTSDDRDGLIPDKYVRIRHRLDHIALQIYRHITLLQGQRGSGIIFQTSVGFFGLYTLYDVDHEHTKTTSGKQWWTIIQRNGLGGCGTIRRISFNRDCSRRCKMNSMLLSPHSRGLLG